MEVLPNVHLLGVFTIAITLVYRRKALYPIYGFVLIQGLFSGFALWWIPYLYLWTVLWGAAMLLLPRDLGRVKPLQVMLLCAAHGYLYGTLYAPAQALLFGLDWKGMVTWILAGLPWDFVHGTSNFFLRAAHPPPGPGPPAARRGTPCGGEVTHPPHTTKEESSMEGLAAAALVIAILTYFEMNKLRKRVDRQQAQMEKICRETGRADLLEPDFPEGVLDRARQLKEEGKAAEAVKLLRQAGDLDLAEAKQYLDKL